MTYRKLAGPNVLEETVNTFDWWTIGVDDIRDEVTVAGLTADVRGEGLVVVRSSAPRAGTR